MALQSISQLQDTWEAQAQADPMWAILSEDSKRRRGWDLGSFLQTGELFVDEVMDRFARLGHEAQGSALDFGCGIGRLTQPLARRFERVTGVDISPTMVVAAERLNRFGESVSYVVNSEPDLAFVRSGSLDMVMSFITLQHIPPPMARSYLTEFIRVLRPGGLLYFQLPSHRNPDLVEPEADVRPISPADCRVTITVARPPSSAVVNEVVRLEVEVRNDSTTTWTSIPQHPLRLANHWFDAEGNTAVNDDGRTGLPRNVGPGDSLTLDLDVTAPGVPGSYGLVLDVVQEGVRWFGDVGSAPFSMPVEVAAGSSKTHDNAPDVSEIFADIVTPEWHEPPAFSMYGINSDEIQDLLTTLGAKVLAMEEHVDDWVSFGYFVAVPDDD